MEKLYRRCKVFILKTGSKNCQHRDVAIYGLAYEFGLAFSTAERIFDSVEG